MLLIPGLELTEQGLSLVLLQPDIKELNDLPSASFCSNAIAASSEDTTTTSS